MTAPGVELVVIEDWREEAARLLAKAARAGGHIALSGGSTPRPAYERAAQLEPDWSRAELWWGDERAVGPDDERSNYRLVGETLLAGIGRAPRAVHRIRGELGAEAAADVYDDEIRGVRLELAFQGLGADGHTASLFPGSPAVEERVRAAVAAEAGLAPYVPRVTLTAPVLSAAPLVVYLVAGAEKAEAAARAFGGPPDPATPASLVRSREGRTVAILDPAAAAHLPGRGAVSSI